MEMEMEHESLAAVSFLEYFSLNFDSCGIIFHICRLADAIEQACLAPIESRKILMLYLHNEAQPFSKTLCTYLTRPVIKELMAERFFLVGWDIANGEYHSGLKQLLRSSNWSQLSNIVNLIESKTSAVLLIVPIKQNITLFSCVRGGAGKVSFKDFHATLKSAAEFLIAENEAETHLEELTAATRMLTGKTDISKDTLGSENFQQLMLDMLGDRDYDSFDYDEHDLLKEKIAFALCGPPTDESGRYGNDERKRIDRLYKVILERSNSISKWKDRVVISFIYNCIEPLPKEKLKRAKKYTDYDPTADLIPQPIFVLRKCKMAPYPEKPCRVFIDHTGRVYGTWQEYITRNKLHECHMMLPLDGKYQADDSGRVLLEQHLSPACGVDAKILTGVDVATTAAGIASGGVVLLAAIPAVTMAPVALVAAGAVGLGAGLYGLGRSAYVLYDRSRHKESLSFANAEARGAYLSIVAGSLGFVGVGATMAVAQLASKGVNIGQGATAVVNVIQITNVSVSGANVLNASYDVIINQWMRENQRPSMLAIVQLGSSILFFGHAVYNFKMAGAIVEEAQAAVLQDYQESLRSNRHRKAFEKLKKETIRTHDNSVSRGQAEVIKTIRNIGSSASSKGDVAAPPLSSSAASASQQQPNKDEVFAVLSRSNKEMNKWGVKFSARDGDILLNGRPIDMSEFVAMDSSERNTFLSQLAVTQEPTAVQIDGMARTIVRHHNNNDSTLGSLLRSESTVELKRLAFNLVKIFGNATDSVKDKIINAVAGLISYLAGSTNYMSMLDELFPNHGAYFRLFQMVETMFQEAVRQMERKYLRWKESLDPALEEPVFPKLALDVSKRTLQLFDYVTQAYFMGSTLTENGLKKLLDHFYTWLTVQICRYTEEEERKERRSAHSANAPREQVKCTVCGGVTYHHQSGNSSRKK